MCVCQTEERCEVSEENSHQFGGSLVHYLLALGTMITWTVCFLLDAAWRVGYQCLLLFVT